MINCTICIISNINWELVISILSLFISIYIAKIANNFVLNEKKEKYFEEISEYYNNIKNITYYINSLISKVIEIIKAKKDANLELEESDILTFQEYYNYYFLKEYNVFQTNIYKFQNKNSIIRFLYTQNFFKKYKDEYFKEYHLFRSDIKYLFNEDVLLNCKIEYLNKIFKNILEVYNKLEHLDKEFYSKYDFDYQLNKFLDSIKNDCFKG